MSANWANLETPKESVKSKKSAKPDYNADYYRSLFTQPREIKAPVRVAMVGKENTCKTGQAIALARQTIGPVKEIVVVDIDNSAAQTIAHNYPDDENIRIIPLFDEMDGSIFNDDNTTNWAALMEKASWFVHFIADACRNGTVGAVIFDGGSTFLKWCEFAMRESLLSRGVIETDGDNFNQKEWRERNRLFRDVINRFHQLPVAFVAYTFHLKDVKEFMDIGSGQKGLMKVGEVPEWENGTKRLFSQQIWLTRYTQKGDVAAGVKADSSLKGNEWVVRAKIEEMKGMHMEHLGTTHEVLRVKDGEVTWNGLPFLDWGFTDDSEAETPDDGGKDDGSHRENEE